MPFRFNGASKSILCQEDEYLLELVWYIEDGFNMGRREDLTGGSLRRSAQVVGKVSWKENANLIPCPNYWVHFTRVRRKAG
jgi:hypothetical protein